MSIFLTFAIIYTIANVLYFVAMVTIDITAKPKKAVAEEEVIDAGIEPDEATSVVENAGGGFSVVGGFGDTSETAEDFVAPPSGEEIDRSMVIGDSGEDYSRYMPPSSDDDEQEQAQAGSITPAPPTVRTSDSSETDVPPEQAMREDNPNEDPGIGVQPHFGDTTRDDGTSGEVLSPDVQAHERQDGENLGENAGEATDGQDDSEHSDDGFDLSRHIYDPDEDERRRKQAQSFDEEAAFTEHLTPNFGISATYFPESSPSVIQEAADNNASLEPIETKGGIMAEDMMNLIKTGAADRLGMEYERY